MDRDADALVVGAIDMHCHHGPDPHRVRSVDAAEAVREAAELGLAGVVLKSHAYPTGPVAILMQKTVERLRVFGGICCDFEVGGLNPAAVEVALRTGAKIVWMPTVDAENETAGRLDGASDKLVRDVTENCRTLKFKEYGFEED